MTISQTASLIANVHVTRRNPVSLVHFITNRCNARCSFCFINFDDPKTFRNELTVAEIDRLTQTVGPDLQNVNITGGEPFARKEILEIARCWFRNTNIRSMFITSNGSLPKRMIDFTSCLNHEFPDRKIIYSLSIDAPPAQHNEIRKINGLFEKTMASYHGLRSIGGQVMATIAITVSHENHAVVDRLYDELIEHYGVRAIVATIVRDEGVYRIPDDHKRRILAAYDRLSNRIAEDLQRGRLQGFGNSSLQGRLMNKKNIILNSIIKSVYLEPHYISQCFAGSLFGIIEANGTVRPCEILDKPLGNLRNYDCNFLRLWHDSPAQAAKRWIKETKCNCTYECAWSFNILGNARYQPALIAAALGKYW
jgi:MoaA/NifB/PqqE/SkfB family radical SAM enzyme